MTGPSSKIPGSLPENLKYLRELKGWNQEELANASGVSLQAIRQWESGIRRPRPHYLMMIAQALGVPISDLVPPPSKLFFTGETTVKYTVRPDHQALTHYISVLHEGSLPRSVAPLRVACSARVRPAGRLRRPVLSRCPSAALLPSYAGPGKCNW